MKNLFNHTPDRENKKKNIYLSPIQQYFDSSPQYIIDNALNGGNHDINKQNLNISYNNSFANHENDKEENLNKDLLNNSKLNEDNSSNYNLKMYFSNNLNNDNNQINNNNNNNKINSNNNNNNYKIIIIIKI